MWRAGVDFEDERARQSAADNAIIKADSRNSINSVIRLLAERNVGVICSGLGEVTESSVLLACFTGAWVVAFNIKVSAQQDKLAQQLGVSVIKSALIYELADALLARYKTVFGRTINGAKANQGCVRLNQCASVYRQNKLAFVSSVTIRTLKRFGRPVDAVRCGQEFGFTLNEQRRIKVGDVLKTF